MGLVENGGGLSIADAMALAGNKNEGGLFEGTSAWVFFLFFLLKRMSLSSHFNFLCLCETR